MLVGRAVKRLQCNVKQNNSRAINLGPQSRIAWNRSVDDETLYYFGTQNRQSRDGKYPEGSFFLNASECFHHKINQKTDFPPI
mmetsp:Transcript_24195/g.78852  ORF Transcript_24195/g.78852 Transcript_24195/m.78852 type:complete len:83 (-) Transcript_24195:956-1204(-)